MKKSKIFIALLISVISLAFCITAVTTFSWLTQGDNTVSVSATGNVIVEVVND